MGLADALVPGRGGDDGLLGDDIRRADTSGTLPTRPDRLESARRDLNCAVASGSIERIATLPRGDPAADGPRSGRAGCATWWAPTRAGRRWIPSPPAWPTPNPPSRPRSFELRQLVRWVRGGGDPARALAARDRLARGFEAGRGRLDGRFTRFDGYVGPGRVSAFDRGTPVSATRFETYAKCPRRYLFDRVLRVSERIRPRSSGASSPSPAAPSSTPSSRHTSPNACTGHRVHSSGSSPSPTGNSTRPRPVVSSASPSSGAWTALPSSATCGASTPRKGPSIPSPPSSHSVAGATRCPRRHRRPRRRPIGGVPGLHRQGGPDLVRAPDGVDYKTGRQGRLSD